MGVFSSANKKVSFRAKDTLVCPVCKEEQHREELMSGGGRLIAGKLTPELRRLYEENKKFGKIYPLAYILDVCPKCLYSSFPKDFAQLSEKEIITLKNSAPLREKLMKTVFTEVDFKKDRDLVLGTASYILAIDCYHFRENSIAPTPKKAVASIRAAWMLHDLYKEASYRPYDKARDFYYMEAVHNYQKCLDLMQTGKEPVESATYMLGPDQDHNWGYDGIIYLNAYLTKKYYSQLADSKAEQMKMLEASKRYLSKLYGTGKKSRNKPSVIVDMSKDLYDELGKIIEEMKQAETSVSV
ncbi:MAG: DUF2225 domain-containing protein [Spirochaetia bacterium]|nr:DUF2225 domain-containing protein [Spirochaetia bacterium]